MQHCTDIKKGRCWFHFSYTFYALLLNFCRTFYFNSGLFNAVLMHYYYTLIPLLYYFCRFYPYFYPTFAPLLPYFYYVFLVVFGILSVYFCTTSAIIKAFILLRDLFLNMACRACNRMYLRLFRLVRV